jgi:hypothetical protein
MVENANLRNKCHAEVVIKKIVIAKQKLEPMTQFDDEGGEGSSRRWDSRGWWANKNGPRPAALAGCRQWERERMGDFGKIDRRIGKSIDFPA